MTQTINVMYSCDGCGITKREVKVKARTTEDVTYWVEQVMGQALSEDHRRVSPYCKSRVMSQVMICITGAEKIGGPAIQ